MSNNFANIFLTHLDDVNHASSTFFTKLYDSKMFMLMSENLHGDFITNKISPEELFKIKEQLKKITTINQLTLVVEILNMRFHKDIPNDTYEDWSTGDYDVYTDKYHHRKYWNEIENHPIIDELIERMIEIFNVTSEYNVYSDRNYSQDKCLWNLRIYDFNDYDLYFETEDNLISFLNTFDNITPCTVFSRNANETVWHEEYSM